ncbi:hypothetical protein ASPBRDRAFT_50878 [Aspergillus brasiliensis CBS 101740]|uniref:BTB domain-containing protein n=1 Tax=Aspergillus brasiliensis (strain CBS 101740 / IMI 381727 / IBT 21946) TaxID=767769 RepID=A0A1L9V2D9_ASPBC|nr:hypothetical protein ASPBRDRAFT_50878 [Aspergillus brasiliensis CBS 101740]
MESRLNTSSYARKFREPPIQVIVGSAKTSYYVHPGALSWCDRSALKARIDGPWKQNGADSPIDWSDFDEQTVECVLSYLYTQDYYVRQSGHVPDDSCKKGDDTTTGIEPFVSSEAKPSTSTFESVPGDKKPLNRPLTPLSQCLEVGLPADNNRTAAGACTYHQASQNPNDSLAAEIMAHAKVYCFAHRYCVRKLEVFALQRLTKVLITINAETETVFPYLTDAIRVVYDSTPSAGLQDNPARKLLSQYVALNYTLLQSESLDQIIAEGGEFMADVSHKLARRLNMTGVDTQSLERQTDELQRKIYNLNRGLQEQESQLQEFMDQLTECQSLNRGLTRKYGKFRR